MRAMRLNQIQEQIGRGEYQVDAHAVADAILRKMLGETRATPEPPKRDHGECS
jgi:hypothetical protein